MLTCSSYRIFNPMRYTGTVGNRRPQILPSPSPPPSLPIPMQQKDMSFSIIYTVSPASEWISIEIFAERKIMVSNGSLWSKE